MLKIASWNVNSIRVRLPQILDWLTEHTPTMLALQETKTVDESFPVEDFQQAGYHSYYTGQKTFNGVAILSREPTEVIATALPDWEDPQKRLLAVRQQNLCLVNVYVPMGTALDSPKYTYKLEWLQRLQEFLPTLYTTCPHLVLVGDINIAPADEDVHDPAAWEGGVLVSAAERQAFQQLLGSGLKDCFRLFTQPPQTFTWWDYRANSYRRKRGLRIDHILARDHSSQHCSGCYTDENPRKSPRPSDHCPVVAEFDVRLLTH